MAEVIEVNCDSLAAPTYNYGGLAVGNLQSIKYAFTTSNPKEAALQGLAKMHLLMELGIPQIVLPPQLRPNLSLLRRLGFAGKLPQVLQKSYKIAPEYFYASYSSASMWLANMATVSPAAHAGKVTITPANLAANLHRAQESQYNYQLLQQIFNDKHFVVHKPLPACSSLTDEGAANHSFLCEDYGGKGLELFVYGKSTGNQTKFPARQTKQASKSIARLHNLTDDNALLIKQSMAAIESGAFHNDVVCCTNKNVMLLHQHSFHEQSWILANIIKKFPGKLQIIEISERALSLNRAVATYLFNSQLVSLKEQTAIIAPLECQKDRQTMAVLQNLQENYQFKPYFVDCQQSMQNGGGPACLRLRVWLTKEQLRSLHGNILLTPQLYELLTSWVQKHYRDRLAKEDLRDPALMQESVLALTELEKILKLDFVQNQLYL